MAHYAKIDQNNKVMKVIVIDEETVNSGNFGSQIVGFKLHLIHTVEYIIIIKLAILVRIKLNL